MAIDDDPGTRPSGSSAVTCLDTGPAQKSPDNIWTEQGDPEIDSFKSGCPRLEDWIRPETYRLVRLDKDALDRVLGNAPMEIPGSKASDVPGAGLICLPDPDGTFMAVVFVESPIMAPELAQKFPEIRTYMGSSVDNPTITVRFDFTPAGFHAQVLQPGAHWYIDPMFRGNSEIYVAYYKTDYRPKEKPFECLFEEEDSSRLQIQEQLHSQVS